MHKVALILAIAAVGEGAVTLHLVRQVHLERENAQTLQARVMELERAPPQRPAGATFIAVPQPTTSPFTVVGKTGAPQPAPVVKGSFAAVDTFFAGVTGPAPDRAQMREQINASMERQRALLRDPEYHDAMLAQQKMMLIRSNADAVKDLELTPEQAEKLFGTLAEQSMRGLENMDAMEWSEQPDTAKLQEAQRKATERYNANEAELKTALGAAKYREWQEYQSTAPARWQATQLRTSLANAGVPLDSNLAKPLLKVLQEQQKLEQQRIEQYVATQPNGARAGFISEPGVTVAGGVNVVGLMTNSVETLTQTQRRQREALARVLTPEQLKVIEDEQASELQMQHLQQRMMQAQQAAGGIDPAQGSAVTFFPGANVTQPVSD